MRLKISVWIICMLCGIDGFAQASHFSLVNPPKETPWSGVLCMTQDAQGYLWIGTLEGLYKYDGHQYTAYRNELKNPNSVSPGKIETLFADKDGMIWIGSYFSATIAGLDRFDPATNTFTHYHHEPGNAGSLVNNVVKAIIQDHEGTMWIGTSGGLDKFDPKTGGFKHFVHNANAPASLSNNQVRVIYEDKQGTLWIGTGSAFDIETPKGEGGLNKLNKKTGKFTRYLHDANDPHSLIDNRVRAIYEDSHGIFWVGTSGDGLHTMDRGKGTFERHLYDPAHPQKLSRPLLKTTDPGVVDHITFINEDIFGEIWIGTYAGGINVYDPVTQKTTWYGDGADSKEKIGVNEFWWAFKSRDGVLWIATFYRPELYKINPYQNKLPYNYTGKTVISFMDDTGNSFWIATKKGLIHKTSDNSQETFYIDKNISSANNGVRFIEKGMDNKLWLSSDHGLYLFDPVKRAFTVFRHQTGNANSLLSDTVFVVKKSGPGKLWVTSLLGLDLMDINAKTFKHFRNDPKDTTSLSSDIVISIETDNDKNIWFGTFNGLNKLDKKTGHFERYFNNQRCVLLNDSRGNLLAGTDNGLFKYDRNTDAFLIFAAEERAVIGMAEDREKNLWLNTYVGLIKVNMQNGETNIYGKSQGVKPDAMSTGYVRHNGDLLWGDTSGYFAFQPDKLLHRTPAPEITINQFLLADVPVLPTAGGILTKPLLNTKKISLNHKQATFSFGFARIDYASEEGDSPVFYMLENYDNKWRKAGSEQTANYYNVPAGNYIFKVKSINIDGLLSEKHIDVIILPPWWQKWWAYVLFALAITGGIWGFVYYRSLSLIKEKRILEHKVHIRTEEVIQQKEEIEAQRDNLEKAFTDLKVTQTQLIQSEKMASLGELTAGIAHEIQNPLNFVNNFSEVNSELLAELKQEISAKNYEEVSAIADNLIGNEQKINMHGKRADAIVKGMLQHSQSGSGLKEPININALVDEYMRLAYHGLRAKDKNFNAELVTHLKHGLPKVNAIPQDIGRVLLNLFNNAFYAVSQKQKSASADYKPEVVAATSIEDGNVIIKIKDNGTGIPDAIKDKIMQPFFTTKPTGEGTGLGLSLTYDMVVKGHGGSIQVNSVEGEGSGFIISLPQNM